MVNPIELIAPVTAWLLSAMRIQSIGMSVIVEGRVGLIDRAGGGEPLCRGSDDDLSSSKFQELLNSHYFDIWK